MSKAIETKHHAPHFYELDPKSLGGGPTAEEQEPLLLTQDAAPAPQDPLFAGQEAAQRSEIRADARASAGAKTAADTETGANAATKTGADDHMDVGPGIVVRGEISGCASIRIAGTLEAGFEGQCMEIVAGGKFKGVAHTATAEINGSAEGDITVTNLLIIHAGARVRGRVRYGAMKMEPGAVISGDIDVFRPDADSSPHAAAAQRPAATAATAAEHGRRHGQTRARSTAKQ